MAAQPHSGREPFGQRIRRLREERGLTQRSLAAQVGVAQASVHDWERGHSQPIFAAGVALAKALGVTAEELAGEP